MIFFILFYSYLWLYIDLRLIYSCGGIITNFPVFVKSWVFFRDYVSHPGGALEYGSAFLSQFFYIGWAGALVVTVQAWFMSECVDYILRTLGLSVLRCFRFVPVVILLIIYTRYTYHFYTTMAFLVALLFVCLYLRTTFFLASNHVRLIVFVIMSIILYYVAGGAYLLYAVLVVLYELLFKRRFPLGLLCLFLAVAVPYVLGVLLFGGSVINAFSDSLPFSWRILTFESRKESITAIYVLYLFLPLTMLSSTLYLKTPGSRIQTCLRSWVKKAKVSAGPPILRSLLESFVLLAIVFATVVFSSNREKKTAFSVHHYACHRMWPEVLKAARHPTENPFVISAVNRALYHTGRLGYDMFCWPQHPDVLLPTGEDRILVSWHKFDTQIDLGLMNMAERNLNECTQVFGEHPMILKRLALINMVKANYDSARIYLGALSKTLFHSDWANDYLALLQSDPDLSTDSRIQYLRSVCPEKDYAVIGYSKEKVLLDLLEKNDKNRMAFEYLTAWHMLTRQLEKCVRSIEHLNNFEYPELPVLYEEALLIYVYGTKKPVQLAGHQLSSKARQQIENFSRIFNSHKRNKQEAFGELARDYGNSYFFYHVYGISGVRK
ncbi:MAG: hypothetical protein AMJ65_01905 [Phycisphaerae bacterium SG8_4]|nr:MAG: hypothetical protein AMJ65_01905 [Phycisphaerae bacterium SG8_4]